MSLHVRYEHQCPSCAAHYIPYDYDVPCPKCGTVETGRFDFIPKAAASASLNAMRAGCYVPPAWYVSGLADHILWIVFSVLEEHRTNADGQGIAEFATEMLGRMQWGEQIYLRDHVQGIVCRVRQQLDKPATSRMNAFGKLLIAVGILLVLTWLLRK
jgi:hypothetical protein